MKRNILAGLVLTALAAGAAQAASYQYRVYLPGFVKPAAVAEPVQPQADVIAVALSGATLPAGTVGQAYSYDFRTLLSITGDSNLDLSQATFTNIGALPTGLSVSALGVVSGIPSAPGSGGFEVVATYKTQTGQQAYTIVVNGVSLQVIQISPSGTHTCAVTTAGGVKCWGADFGGQLGDDAAIADKLTPVDVMGLTSGVVSISNGYQHTCAVTAAGGAKCWGTDTDGQLGNDAATTNQPTPVDVQGLTSGVVSISASYKHTCAVTASGGAKCWGRNDQGQIGDAAVASWRPTPVDVQGLTSGVASISAGAYHTCAVMTTGGAKCWGYDYHGQLGDDVALVNKWFATDVQGLTSGVASISAGQLHTCAVLTSGGAKCWGLDSQGQLGNDAALSDKPTPVDVQGLTSGAARISAGAFHTCAVTTAGGAKCWGRDSDGQLGDDAALASKPTPVDVQGLTTGVASIAAANSYTCAVLTSSGSKCWGYNSKGQLGIGATGYNTIKPTPLDVVP